MTIVFMCQPLGQLAATLVALIAVARQRDGISGYSLVNGTADCKGNCLQTLDSVWRWVIGVGAVPAIIALWFRLTIIESPRYTADVGRDSRKALSELARYQPQEDSIRTASSLDISSHEVQDIEEESPVNISEDGTTLQNPGKPQGTGEEEEHLTDEFADADEATKPPPPSWRDFKDYFWHRGNLRTLMATSFCWFCVDL